MSRAVSMTALAGLATGGNTELFDLHIVKWLIFNLEYENLGEKVSEVYVERIFKRPCSLHVRLSKHVLFYAV